MRILAALLVFALVGPALAGPKAKATSKKTIRRPRETIAKSSRALINKLTTRKLTFHFKKASVTEFLKYVRAAVGVNIVVMRGTLAKEGIDLDALEIDLELNNVRAIDALKLALGPLELGLKAKGNILIITTKKDAKGKPTLVVYDIASLMFAIRDFPAPDINVYPTSYEPPEPDEPEVHQGFESSDEVAEMVRNFVAQDTWEDEGITIMVFRRHLFIRQYPSVHRKIARFLHTLQGLH